MYFSLVEETYQKHIKDGLFYKDLFTIYQVHPEEVKIPLSL